MVDDYLYERRRRGLCRRRQKKMDRSAMSVPAGMTVPATTEEYGQVGEECSGDDRSWTASSESRDGEAEQRPREKSESGLGQHWFTTTARARLARPHPILHFPATAPAGRRPRRRLEADSREGAASQETVGHSDSTRATGHSDSRTDSTDLDQKVKMDAQANTTPVHRNDADEDDENVKQLQQCSSIYLLLQECLVNSNRNWKACQKGRCLPFSSHSQEVKPICSFSQTTIAREIVGGAI